MSKLTLDQLRAYEVPAGSIAVWWLGQSGYFLKSPAGMLAVMDPYFSNACKDDGDKYGMDADRRVPAPMTGQDLNGVDLYVLTHSHLDHMDPDTVEGYQEAGGEGPYLAPAETWELLQSRCDVPAEQITMTWPNKTHTLGDLTFRTTFSIGFGADDMTHVGYLVSLQNGPILYFTGDTAYEDLVAIGVRDHKPDVMFTVINPGFRNLGPAEAAKLAKEVDAKIVIPCHYDLFHCNTCPPQMLHTNLIILGIGDRYRELEHFKPYVF
jgi:L-ascorbate 6-phosphate lactonase